MENETWDYEWTEPGYRSFSFTSKDGTKVSVQSYVSVSGVEGKYRKNRMKNRVTVNCQSNGVSISSYSYSSSSIRDEDP